MSATPELRVALLQYAIEQSAPDANRQKVERLVAQLPPDVDLVVLPEMFTTGFGPHAVRDAEAMDGPTVEWMKTISRSHGFFLMGSLPVQEGRTVYNRLVGISPEGHLHYVDKRHRAIENQAFVIGVNCVGRDAKGVSYGGNSALIRYDGAAMLQAGEVETILHCRIHHHELYKFRAQFPFLDDRDAFTIHL